MVEMTINNPINTNFISHSCAVEPLTGEVFRMPHETELWDTHVLFYRHRIFFFTVMRLFFLTFRRFGSVPAVRKEKRMYYDQHVCGARIQELRKSKGYTQEALAEAIDIDGKTHFQN